MDILIFKTSKELIMESSTLMSNLARELSVRYFKNFCQLLSNITTTGVMMHLTISLLVKSSKSTTIISPVELTMMLTLRL